MKSLLKGFLATILTIFFSSTTLYSQNTSDNCDIARKKYLEQNPDVEKAKMDPWNHYQSYGKREGRIWPSCIVESNSNTPKFHLHECKYLNGGNVGASSAFSTNEDIIDKYKKITKKNPILFKEINGAKCCKIYYCSLNDKAVHQGEFTEYDLSLLNAYKFQSLEDCLEIIQLIERLSLTTPTDEESLIIKTNVKEYEARTIEDDIYLGKSTGYSLSYKFEKLKNKYLTVSIKHPACKDTIIELNKKERNEYARLEFTDNYLKDNFAALVKGDYMNNINSLKAFQIITTNDELYKEFSDAIDLIELNQCLVSGSNEMIDAFVQKKPFSQEYKKAIEIVQYFKNADASYNEVLSKNNIEGYENFLNNYKYSKYRTDVQKKLVEQALILYTRIGTVDTLLYCYKNYITPYNNLGNWIDNITITITKELEKALMNENKSNNTINEYAAHWTKMMDVEKVINTNFKKFRLYVTTIIPNQYFDLLRNNSSKNSQDSIINSFKNNFESLTTYYNIDPSDKNIVNYILNNTKDKSGMLKLYSTDYLTKYLVDSIRNFKNDFSYKNNTYSISKTSESIILNWENNQLSGIQSTYDKDGLEFRITFTSYPHYSLLEYFQKGKLVTEMHFENDAFQYQYEFENGENISLKNLRDLTALGDKFMAEKKYDLAADAYSKAKNKYPSSLPENIHLNKSIASCVSYLKELAAREQENKNDESRTTENKSTDKNSDDNKKNNPINTKSTTKNYEDMSLNFVINKLKSPGSAQFVDYLDAIETKEILIKAGFRLKECTEVTRVVVDSQNGFGALLRSTWFVFFKSGMACHAEEAKSLQNTGMGDKTMMINMALEWNNCDCSK